MFPVQIRGQQQLQNRRTVLQVVNRFKKWRDIQGYFTALVVQFTPLGQQHHRENIVCSLCHADDIRTDRLRSVFPATKGDCLKYGDRLACLGAGIHWSAFA